MIPQYNVEQMVLHREYIYDTLMYVANQSTELDCYVERNNFNRPDNTYVSMFIEEMEVLGYYNCPDTGIPDGATELHEKRYTHYRTTITINTWKQNANAYLMAIQSAFKSGSAIQFMRERNVGWLSESSVSNTTTVLDNTWEERANMVLIVNTYIGYVDPLEFMYIDSVDITGNVAICYKSSVPDESLVNVEVEVNVLDDCEGFPVAPEITVPNFLIGSGVNVTYYLDNDLYTLVMPHNNTGYTVDSNNNIYGVEVLDSSTYRIHKYDGLSNTELEFHDESVTVTLNYAAIDIRDNVLYVSSTESGSYPQNIVIDELNLADYNLINRFPSAEAGFDTSTMVDIAASPTDMLNITISNYLLYNYDMTNTGFVNASSPISVDNVKGITFDDTGQVYLSLDNNTIEVYSSFSMNNLVDTHSVSTSGTLDILNS